MNEDKQIEVEIRVLDDDGNEDRMIKKMNISATSNGVDAYFMYEQLIYFMRMVGYGESTIDMIKWVEDEEE